MADYQDTKTTVLRKHGPRGAPKGAHDLAKAKRSGQVETEKKYGGGGNSGDASAVYARKLDEMDHEDLSLPKPTLSFSRALQQARAAKKMSQKDLAQRLNVKPTLINELESGKGIAPPQLVQKINRVLGCTLPKIPKKKVRKSED